MPGQHSGVWFHTIDGANLMIRGVIVEFTEDSDIAIVTAVWGRNPRIWMVL